MEKQLKCLHCGFEYAATESSKQKVQERVCPSCKSNSVRKLSSKTE